jgi:Zn-dependent protease with chaperone function
MLQRDYQFVDWDDSRVTAIWLIGICAACAGFAWAANGLALIRWRRARDAHWTERARLLFPVRVAAGSNVLFLPVTVALALRFLEPAEAPGLLAIAFVAWAGTLAGTFPFDLEVVPWLSAGDLLRQASVAWLFKFARWFLFLGAMALMPETVDWRSWLLAGAVVGFQAILVWGGAIWIASRLALVKPVPERVQAIIDQVAGKMQIAVRSAWTVRSSNANALAIPHTRDLIFTERALAILPEDELAAVCAHELGHLAESKASQLLRFLASLFLLPWLFLRPLWVAFGPGALGILLVSTVILWWLIRWLGKRLEIRADAAALANQGEAGVYARALARLYEDNQTPAVLPERRQIHPNLYDRLLAAGVTPDYPRPAVPASMSWHGLLVAVLFGLLLGLSWVALMR